MQKCLKLKMVVCSVCGNKKSRFISNDQKCRGILSSLGIRTPLSQIP